MERKNKLRHVDAILTADWHLRDTTPVCRTDDFEAAQWNKVRFIAGLQEKYNCPVIHSGDLFHHWKPSPELLSKTIENIPKRFLTVYGNHDLPQHNMELAYKSGINTLKTAKALEVLDFGYWDSTPKPEDCLVFEPRDFDNEYEMRRMNIWHVFTYTGGLPWPGCKASHAQKLIEKYDFDIIVTGDNHKPFAIYSNDGKRLLVNPGSLTRQTADQIDFKPRVYLWDAIRNLVEPVYLPVEDGVISREHLEIKEQRDGRIDAFISRLELNFEMGFSFEDNLKEFFDKNSVRKSVRDIIYKSIEV